MIAIVDYGVGNLFSLESSFRAIDREAVVTADPQLIRGSERIILPGVGAFGDAAERLKSSGLRDVLLEAVGNGRLLLGICLGMQLLLEKSEEYGDHDGLCLISGTNRAISQVIPEELKIPHMGWNSLSFKGQKHPLFRYVEEGEYVYFVHSYAGFDCKENVIATTDYGTEITAAVARKNVMGTQFHPEKSGDTGLKILRAFCELREEELC